MVAKSMEGASYHESTAFAFASGHDTNSGTMSRPMLSYNEILLLLVMDGSTNPKPNGGLDLRSGSQYVCGWLYRRVEGE